MVSPTLLRYVFLAAARDRILLFALLVMVAASSLSMMLGGTVVVEQDKFALVFMAASLRLAAVFIIVLFVSFYIRRAFDSRDVDFLLTRPVSRPCFLVTHALAFSLIAALAGVLLSGIVFGIFFPGFHDGYLLWGAGVTAELVIMANAALFFSMVLPNAVGSVLSCAGLYVLARMIGEIFGIIDHDSAGAAASLMKGAMETVSLIIPRFDLMAQTTWLVYPSIGSGHVGFGYIAAHCAVFSVLLIAAAMIDLLRRQF